VAIDSFLPGEAAAIGRGLSAPRCAASGTLFHLPQPGYGQVMLENHLPEIVGKPFEIPVHFGAIIL